MDNVAKYKLKPIKEDETYTACRIVGLKNAYHKSYNGELEDYGGACGLVKNAEHKGYCNLCMTYHSLNDEKVGRTNLPDPVYVVEFSPLYNESGQMILIEYDRDEVFCIIDRGGYQDYDTKKIVDADITFWKHGAFTEFRH